MYDSIGDVEECSCTFNAEATSSFHCLISTSKLMAASSDTFSYAAAISKMHLFSYIPEEHFSGLLANDLLLSLFLFQHE